MSEDQSSDYEQLQSRKSLGEILDVAISFERSARDFYTALTPQVSKQIRYLVQELAQEEQRHFELFTQLRARTDIEQQLQEMVAIPASDSRFSDAIQLPELGKTPDA